MPISIAISWLIRGYSYPIHIPFISNSYSIHDYCHVDHGHLLLKFQRTMVIFHSKLLVYQSLFLDHSYIHIPRIFHSFPISLCLSISLSHFYSSLIHVFPRFRSFSMSFCFSHAFSHFIAFHRHGSGRAIQRYGPLHLPGPLPGGGGHQSAARPGRGRPSHLDR